MKAILDWYLWCLFLQTLLVMAVRLHVAGEKLMSLKQWHKLWLFCLLWKAELYYGLLFIMLIVSCICNLEYFWTWKTSFSPILASVNWVCMWCLIAMHLYAAVHAYPSFVYLIQTLFMFLWPTVTCINCSSWKI